MDRAAADAVTKALLTNIHLKLQDAGCIAKAAEACAASGNAQSAVKMVMDIEEPTYQANRMLNAALLISGGLPNETTTSSQAAPVLGTSNALQSLIAEVLIGFGISSQQTVKFAFS